MKALSLVSDNDDFIELRAGIKKILAINLKDIFGPRKPEDLTLLKESLEDFAKLNKPSQEANLLQHIGGVNLSLGYLEEADRVLSAALQKARSSDDLQLQGWILRGMAHSRQAKRLCLA